MSTQTSFDFTAATVVLIACCGQKAETACAARDLYRSPLFRKSVAYAERRGLSWAILSAEHGLVLADDVVAPYDVTLTAMSAAERKAWAVKTNAQIKAAFTGARFVTIAGKHYRGALAGLPNTVPFEGMGIGEQLHALTVDAVEYAPEVDDAPDATDAYLDRYGDTLSDARGER